MVSAPALDDVTPSRSDGDDLMERLGRVALVTHGALYLVVAALALAVARGDSGAEASQQGALEAVARQPAGQVLIWLLVGGLVALAVWRAARAVRGSGGGADDGDDALHRAIDGGRAVLYGSLAVAAVGVATRGPESSSQSGETEQTGTAVLLGLPFGVALVVAVGLGVAAAGAWNLHKGVTQSFAEDLDLSDRSERARRALVAAGVVGHVARAAAFGLVAWFLVRAGLQHDPDQARGLDGALEELAGATHGPWVLAALAVGLALFGCFRIGDGWTRRRSELTHA